MNQKYSFILMKPYGTSIRKYQGLLTYPRSTVSTFDEHLMLLGMDLTSTTTFKENRILSFTALADCKRKNYAYMLVKN